MITKIKNIYRGKSILFILMPIIAITPFVFISLPMKYTLLELGVNVDTTKAFWGLLLCFIPLNILATMFKDIHKHYALKVAKEGTIKFNILLLALHCFLVVLFSTITLIVMFFINSQKEFIIISLYIALLFVCILNEIALFNKKK